MLCCVKKLANLNIVQSLRAIVVQAEWKYDLDYKHCAWSTVYEALCMKHCAWNTVHETLCMKLCAWSTVHEALCMKLCAWSTVHEALCMKHCAWSTVDEALCMKLCAWNTVHETLCWTKDDAWRAGAWLKHHRILIKWTDTQLSISSSGCLF